MSSLLSPLRRLCKWRLALLLILLAIVPVSVRRLSAHDPPTSQLFVEQLATGEFAPALESTRLLESTPARDARLVQLAEAQAGSGARDGALYTLAYVQDDRTRSAAVQTIRQTPEAVAGRGGAQADFDTLIDLLTSTVRPPSWEDVGGLGTISEFQNGVYVDADGTLERVLQPRKSAGLAVARLAALVASEDVDPRRFSPLRKVSLARLEKHVQLSLAAGRPLDDEMLNLAGLEKIKFVFVYPATGDLVLAGPAGPWRIDLEGRHVSQKSGRPVLQLDDLVVMLRFLSAAPRSTLGCSIDPTTEGLARTRDFAAQSSAAPLKAGQRPAWLKKLREQMGRQTISVEGIDPRTRAARVLVEADFRMKLVGMGLEEGTVDVPSYLELIEVARASSAPPLDVLRWWFTLKYDAVRATSARDAFEIRGQGVQVLSENELLTQLGQRVHTGKSDPPNQEFTQRFTRHFAALGQKYPVYADLENIFDLALVSALISSEKLAERVGWHMTCFSDPEQYQASLGKSPRFVETVINHRVVHGRQIIVGVSGGVHVEPWPLVKRESIEVETYGKLDGQRANSTAEEMPIEAWWWD
jgi:hypothetical protein